jgi:hypothetical protein
LITWVALSKGLSAQDFGRIGGTVSDSSGAVIGGATVRVINTQTNSATTFTTNDQGRFTADNLAPGTYRIEVGAQGFKQLVQTAISVHVGDVLDLTLGLEVGSAADAVTVSGGAPLLETSTSATGAVFESQLMGDSVMRRMIAR